MLGYTDAITLFKTLTNNTSTANVTFGDTMLNEGVRLMLGALPWPFLETTSTASTVAGQQTYTIPNVDRLNDVYIQVGTYKYVPTQVTSNSEWNLLNNPTGVQSDAVSHYFIEGNEIQFWPVPASSSNTITYSYQQKIRDYNVADYTTGNISAVANGGTTVTGSGTSWTAGMVGKYLRITASNSANVGDGLWYKISAVGSTTSLTLDTPYTGTAITAGSAAYKIVDAPIIPEKYQLGPVYYATSEYFRKTGEDGKADRYANQFAELMNQMKNEEGTKTDSVVIDDGTETTIINPNLNKQSS
jgi:hypothetical protein